MPSNNASQTFTQAQSKPSRRQFLKGLFGGVAATSLLPTAALRAAIRTSLPVPTLAAGANVDESFWHIVKDQFPIREGLIVMNAANLCPSPYPVMETVFQLTRDVDADVSYQNRGKFSRFHENGLNLLAEYLGASADELVITRNTSEGNNMVVNGLDLNAEDEVVIWDENHPTNNIAWDVRAQRSGFKVKKVSLPNHPKSDEDLVRPFTSAFSPKTKVLAFSHVSNVTGVGVPAKKLCYMARERGILTLIDGAQTFGAFPLDLHDLGCDFFTGSSHKWFIGPKEAGILYVRQDSVQQVWPNQVGVGWEQSKDRGAHKFSTLGQRDDATVSAMGKTVEFHNLIGKTRIETRIRELAAFLRSEIERSLSDVKIITPEEPQYSAGVLVFSSAAVDTSSALTTLYKQHNIACTVRGQNIRLCPHIYNTMEEVDKVVAALKSLS
ncbi:aminotransferase class V-fold PLP-dependent enzyme [bacterium]|nr:aminotransferase class V-fold PLP-dependent enzyme [bacterium]